MNRRKLFGNTQDIEKIALIVVALAGKAASNREIREALLVLAERARKWRPSARLDKLNRKLRAVTDYANEVREQFPDAAGPDEWDLRARNLGARARLAKSLSGRARRQAMSEVWEATDDLLRGALATTAELLQAQTPSDEWPLMGASDAS